MKYYNKINRNLKLNLRLYFNDKSYNRTSDITPRFFVSIDLDNPIEGIERLGWTHQARKKHYKEYTPHFFGGKQEEYLKDPKVLDLIKKINKISPYGYSEEVEGSKDRYNTEVRFNPARQSFWKSYWEKNIKKVKKPTKGYPYIEVSYNEMIRTKFLVKIPEDYNIYGTESSSTNTVIKKASASECDDNLFIVTWDTLNTQFLIDEEPKKTLNLAVGQTYTFINKSYDSSSEELPHCVTGIIPFRFSMSWDGIHTKENIFDKHLRGSTYLANVNLMHAGTVTDSETVEVVIDENSPNVMHYYSPQHPEAGGIVAINQSCDKGDDVFTSIAPSGDWHKNVTIDSSGSYITIKSKPIPNHCAVGHDDYNNLSQSDITWAIPSEGAPVTIEDRVRVPAGPIGIAIDGIPFYNAYTGEGYNTAKLQTKDKCNGFIDADNIYNYKLNPSCAYVDIEGEHSPVIGYAFDGYPIYGPRDNGGNSIRSSELDEYHGHEQDGRGYHYHVTEDSPYILGSYYKGAPYVGNFIGEGGNNAPPSFSSYS